MFKSLLSEWLPPALVSQLKKIYSKQVVFSGRYESWDEALKRCNGYAEEHIAKKVLEATLQVKSGKAVFERDSVLFDKIHYSWPVLSVLMWTAAQNKGKLHVLDFGGALGSSYFQNKKFLDALDEVTWTILEQESFVKLGKKFIADNFIRFDSLDNLISENFQPDVLLMSSVLQYLSSPYALLEELLSIGPKLIIFDRTSFINSGDEDIIYIQNVPKEIYKASYPCWFFSRTKLCKYLNKHGYKVLEYFDSNEKLHENAVWGGIILIKVGDD